VDGKQYELPYSWNPMVIYYNTARLKEAGLEPPKSDWTRDQFLEYAQKLTVDANGDGTPEKYGYAFDNSGLFRLGPCPGFMPTAVLSCRTTSARPPSTDPKVEEALQFMHDLIYKIQSLPRTNAVEYPVPVDSDGGRGDDWRRSLGSACPVCGEVSMTSTS